MSKVYVLVRGDLSRSQQAVQACHATSVLVNTLSLNWSHQTMVVLKVKDLTDLLIWRERIIANKQTIVQFDEPDLNDETTAIAAYGPELDGMLAYLPLL